MFNAGRRAVVTGLLLLGVSALSLGVAGAAPQQAEGDLVGTFTITAGSCSGGPSGSYFRMVHPSGTPAAGPYVDNSDSACGTKSYTLLTPGTDGGLVTGAYQPAPNPGFDGAGHSLATRLIRPVRFFGVDFSGSTNPTDLQTGGATPAPSLRNEGGRLVGDLSAFDATWNKQAFNQGSPKPDRSRPGNTTAVSGTIDSATGAFTLTWTSQIVDGAFDNFTGVWHLEGTFRPAGAPAPAPVVGGPAVTTPSAGAPTAADPAQPATEDTVAPSGAGQSGAPAADGSSMADEVALAASVQDDSFQAPTWLVVLIALAGIGGVVALVALSRASEPVTEGG
jgi:hypothetical protein